MSKKLNRKGLLKKMIMRRKETRKYEQARTVVERDKVDLFKNPLFSCVLD